MTKTRTYAALVGAMLTWSGAMAACSSDEPPAAAAASQAGAGGEANGGAGPGAGGAGGEGGALPCVQTPAGVCAGVSLDPICAGDLRYLGVSCTETAEVTTDAELQAAAAAAEDGTCIALAPGAYEAVELEGGALLGAGASLVQIAGVHLSGGSDALVRGLTIGAAGLTIDGASGTRVEAVRVVGAEGSGIRLTGDAGLALTGSEVRNAGSYGIEAFGTGDVTVEASLLAGNDGPGLWSACAPTAPPACDCAATPSVSLTSVVAEGNAGVGLAIGDANALLRDVRVSGTRDEGDGGTGLYAFCSHLDAEGVLVQGGEGLAYGSSGVLLNDVTGSLGGDGDDKGIIVVDGKPGFWVMNGQTGDVTLHNLQIVDAVGVALGTSFGAKGIIVVDGKVAGTQSPSAGLARAVAGIGYGLAWLDGARFDVDGLEIAASEKLGVLIDGVVADDSVLGDVALVAGDEEGGIVQQGVAPGPGGPEVEGTTPAVQQQAERTFPVPDGPRVPSPVGVVPCSTWQVLAGPTCVDVWVQAHAEPDETEGDAYFAAGDALSDHIFYASSTEVESERFVRRFKAPDVVDELPLPTANDLCDCGLLPAPVVYKGELFVFGDFGQRLTKDGWGDVTSYNGDLVRGGSATAVLGDEIYLVGGSQGAMTATPRVAVYDPVAAGFDLTLANYPVDVAGAAAVAASGRLYVIGGATTATVMGIFNAGAWKTEALPFDAPSPRAAALGGRLFVFVGGTAHVFDTTAGTWALDAFALPEGNWYPAATQTELFIVGDDGEELRILRWVLELP